MLEKIKQTAEFLKSKIDALPEIGHACGHNLIATAALGASLALGTCKKDLPGKLIFLGTPAEEGGGGKIHMINNGLFEGVDAAMMFHPSSIYLWRALLPSWSRALPL